MYAAIVIPNFSLQAILRLNEELRARAMAVIDEENRVLQMTAAARESGVELGMTPPQAMARCPNIVLRSRSLLQEEAAQKAILQCSSAFSPFLESTAHGICTINLRGLSEFGVFSFDLPDRAQVWANRLLTRIGALQLHGQIGLAPDPDVALLAARLAEPILLVQDIAVFLATVPLQAAGMPAPLFEIISKWGLRSVGELRALGSDELASRFGSEIIAFLDSIAPARPRPLTWVAPASDFEEFLELEYEIESLEPLLFILRRFLDQLSHRLESVYLVAQEIRLTLKLSSGANYERALSIPAPTRNVNTLFRMLHTHLENLQTDAPIVAVRLRAEPARAQNHQFGLFQSSLRDPNQFFETLARLEALLGPGRSGSPINEASHKPDDFRIEQPCFHGLSVGSQVDAPRESIGPALRRFRPVVQLKVSFENENLIHIESKFVKGRIIAASGPWRLSGHWWENGWARDEWDVRLQNGRGCRIFQQEQKWFLEGLFD